MNWRLIALLGMMERRAMYRGFVISHYPRQALPWEGWNDGIRFRADTKGGLKELIRDYLK
jgi:hypothetical protein